MDDLARRLKDRALALGFDRVGIAPARTPPHYPDFLAWLDAGRDAGMDYLAEHAEARGHPGAVLEGVRSVVMASMVCGGGLDRPEIGKLARYAPGDDYHSVLRGRLERLVEWLREEAPNVAARAVVDTAPLMERDFARLAGLGWIGKNTMLIDRKLGSFTVLGALLVDAELEPDPPHDTSHCGTCTRCLEACPTDAFVGPYQLDARRCISYWTIEHKGPIPDEAAAALHGWTFGCDVCQDVCPWNRKAPSSRLPEFAPRPEWESPDPVEWLNRTRSQWKRLFRNSALRRAGRSGLVRNAALVLGTAGRADAIPALAERLADPREDPTIRDAAAWALDRIGTAEARAALQTHGKEVKPSRSEPC